MNIYIIVFSTYCLNIWLSVVYFWYDISMYISNRKKKIEYEIRLAEDKRVAERRRINALSSNTTKKWKLNYWFQDY